LGKSRPPSRHRHPASGGFVLRLLPGERTDLTFLELRQTLTDETKLLPQENDPGREEMKITDAQAILISIPLRKPTSMSI